MPINWGLMDTQYPQKLSDLFNPASIQQRQVAASDQNTMNQLRQAQLMQAAQGLQRAPVLAQREDAAYTQQQAELTRKQAEEARKKRLLGMLNEDVPPNIRQQIMTQLYPEKAAEQAFKAPNVRDFNQPFNPDGTPNEAYQDYQRSLKPEKVDNTLVAVIGPDGQTPTLVPRSQAAGMTPMAGKAASKPTEQEAKAAFYAQNMKAASKTLDALEAAGYDLTDISSQAGTALAGGFTNAFASKEAQQAKQAQNQWAEQMLRMQTGAAATQSEIERTVKTYFPTVGDEKDTVDLKRSMRQQAEGGVYEAAGRAQNRVPQSGASGSWGITRVK